MNQPGYPTTPCNRCEALPEESLKTGVLYVSPPMAPTWEAIMTVAKSLSIPVREYPGHTLGIPLTPETKSRLCRALQHRLSDMELADTKTLFLAENETLGIESLGRVARLGEFLCLLDNRWFVALLKEERLESWFQPIVRADQPQDVFAYECLIRGKGEKGETIFPGTLFETARKSDLLFYFDRICRQTAIRNASENRISTRIFINFNPTTIYNPVHCLKTTMAAIKETGMSFENIVFEVVETDKIQDVSHLFKIIDYYKKMGFGLALDDLGAGYSSLNLLHQINPDYIKIDLELIRGVHKDRSKGIIVRNLLSIARDLNILSIAEGVETVEEWQWLKSHGADYLQGYLFAKPAPVPPTPMTPEGLP